MGTPGSAKPEAGARDRMEAGDPALPATEGRCDGTFELKLSNKHNDRYLNTSGVLV